MTPAVLILVAQTVVTLTHPSLYYEGSDVPAYQAAAHSTHAAIATALRAGAGYASSTRPASLGFLQDRGNALVAFSISCMVTQDPVICQGAHQWVTDMMGLVDPNGAWETDPDFIQADYLKGFAISYDVLSDPTLPSHLSASEQAQLRNLIAAGCRYFAGKMTSGQLWYLPEYSQNHNWEDIGALGVAALAIDGEVADDTRGWINLALGDYLKVEQVLNLIPDGTWHEGYSYEGSSLSAWLWFPVALRHAIQMGRLTGVPDLTDNPLLKGFGKYRTVASLPGRTYQSILLHGDFFGWSSDETVLVLRYVAARFGDRDAAWLAVRQINDKPYNTYGYEQNATALEYLIFDPRVEPLTPTSRDLYLSDLAGFITRSSYDANAAVLGVKAGAFGGLGNWANDQARGAPGGYINFGHDHVDDLGFWFYANGQWLAPEAAGYVTHPTPTAGFPLAYNTEFHNTFTVDGVGQLGDNDWCGGSTYGTCVDYNRKARILQHAATANMSYVEMEGAALYPARLGLTQVRRQLFFLHRNVVVVRDALASSTPHTFEWNSHAMNGAVQDGSWIRGVGLNDQALGMRVIAPTQWSLTTSEQSPQYINDAFDPDGNTTRLTVRPTTPGTTARFLVAMEPTTSSAWQARSPIDPLGDAAAARGLTLGNGGGDWIFSDGPAETVSAGTLGLTGRAGGLQASGVQTVYVLFDGAALTQGGAEVLSADAVNGAIEVSVTATSVTVSAQGATHARVLAAQASTATWNDGPATLMRDPADARYAVVTPGAAGGGPADAGADAGLPAADAGAADAGARDAGLPASDAGAVDAGQPDGGRSDAGAAADGGAGQRVPDGGHECTTMTTQGGCSAAGGTLVSWLLMLGWGTPLAFRRRTRR